MAERPLTDVEVVVTRPQTDDDRLTTRLESLGARVIAVPLIEIVAFDNAETVRAAVADADWVVVTTSNSAKALAGVPYTAKVAAVGTATAAALPHVDLVPERQNAAGLVEAMPTGDGLVILLQARGGAPTLADDLRGKGWRVARIDTHEARPLEPTREQQMAMLRAAALVLTSGSQARAWVASIGTVAPPVVVAMGPQTADDARAAGLTVTAVADEHSLEGVVATLVAEIGR